MGKHRKTREQKIIADYRRKPYILENKNTFSPTTISVSSSPSINTNTNYSYSLVMYDIRKTGILTLAIIAVQIILFLFLKNHIIKLPNISY